MRILFHKLTDQRHALEIVRDDGHRERVAGAMSGIAKGRSAADLVQGFRQSAASTGTPAPPWLTEPISEAAAERLRGLTGHWRATPHGRAMAIEWPAG